MNPENQTRKRTLGKAIEAALVQSKLSQEEFSRLTSFDRSKTSRLISGKISADAETIDAILRAFESKTTKFQILCAYINDLTTADAKKHFKIVPRSGARPNDIDAGALSPDGISALRFIISQAEQGHSVENIFIEFARATGWRIKKS